MALRTLLARSDLLTMPAIQAQEIEKKESDWQDPLDVTAAFLGPTLWNKTLPLDCGDFKIPPGVDLYEYLSEAELDIAYISSLTNNAKCANNEYNHHSSNGQGLKVGTIQEKLATNEMKVEKELLPTHMHQDDSDEATSSTDTSSLDESRFNVACTVEGDNRNRVMHDLDVTFSPDDIALASVPGQRGFDPKRRAFSDEELKPQPMSKKSRKQFVPDQMKDDKYWARRTKNNMAAKRSRDARRIKENQIALRASFLEKENNSLRKELDIFRRDNAALIAKLKQYET